MKTILIILLVILVLLIIYCINNKVRIKWKTFLKKGFRPIRGNFGVYCYCGKQGTGKTYSVVEYLLDNKESIVAFCNVANIQGIDYFHFTGFKELLKLKQIIDFKYSNIIELKDYILELGFDYERTCKLVDLLEDYYNNEKQLIIVYDEIFTELLKGSKLGKEVLDFLCQMRKRQIIFLTTAQEWAEIPLTFRRFCRYQIDCKMVPILTSGVLIKVFKDAENMKWSDEDQEHIAPLVETTITHTRKYVANSYDTFLRISSVACPTTQTEEGSNFVIKDVSLELNTKN